MMLWVHNCWYSKDSNTPWIIFYIPSTSIKQKTFRYKVVVPVRTLLTCMKFIKYLLLNMIHFKRIVFASNKWFISKELCLQEAITVYLCPKCNCNIFMFPLIHPQLTLLQEERIYLDIWKVNFNDLSQIKYETSAVIKTTMHLLVV